MRSCVRTECIRKLHYTCTVILQVNYIIRLQHAIIHTILKGKRKL
jgi:hypothetical protein